MSNKPLTPARAAQLRAMMDGQDRTVPNWLIDDYDDWILFVSRHGCVSIDIDKARSALEEHDGETT